MSASAFLRVISAALLIALASRDAGAQNAPPPATESPTPSSSADRFDVSGGSVGTEFDGKRDRTGVSLTLSPIHLFGPILAVQGELALLPKLSVDLGVAYGHVSVVDPRDTSSSPAAVNRAIASVAPHVRYYVVGEYLAGFPVSFGLRYTHVDSDQVVDAVLFNTTNSVALEALLGFKYVFRNGAVVDFLTGADFLLKRFTPADPTQPGVTAPLPRNAFLVFAFDIGFSF
jgi:hypothetical protein